MLCKALLGLYYFFSLYLIFKEINVMYIFCVCTGLHNCSSLGSLRSQNYAK